jgi:hypothetical protein
MFNRNREINWTALTDGELTAELVACLPCDEEGALFWV